ncbi:hypothetical protein P4S95_04035 [Aneurinibacillus aneurinilyticus]|jgi:flagellar biosynthesis GTPase FlhF|uniref:Lipoprotein n=1 Tax=Aneurinibacillus aneurinilyticus TaxID=1391 RepID=A0A848D1B7_ANEAE|nr:hypothetical protein [Aneurinibacillus aneurinilyticus]MED0669398.1 hypothetical protein [Aneurinibacillus aneurinilyticus]NMF01456.1 hypothetical protein [Aneurinibacillus aneurinilyticus]
MKKSLLFTSLAVLSLSLTGCGDSSSTSTPASQQEQQDTSEETKKQNEEAAKKQAEEEAKQKAKEEAEKKAMLEKTKYAEIAKASFSKMTENSPELPQQTYDFMVENHKLFPAKTPEDIKKAKDMADKSISAKHLNKNAAPYFNKITTFSGDVVNVQEAPIDDNDTLSLLHILDNNMQSYQVVIYKSTGDILQGDTVRFWGVPAGPSSFTNVAGGTTNVQLFVGAHVEKQGK